VAVGVDGGVGVRGDEVGVDRRAGRLSRDGGGHHLGTDVSDVARHPHTGYGGRPVRVGGNLAAGDVPAHLHVDRLEPERLQHADPGGEPGRDDHRVERDDLARTQPYPGQRVPGHLQAGHRARHDGDRARREPLRLLSLGCRAVVQQEQHVRAPLPPQLRLVRGPWPGGQHADAPVADLPPVAVRAVQHVTTPPLGQPGHVGQLVDQPGRHQ
jgi:hypothetical protein